MTSSVASSLELYIIVTVCSVVQSVSLCLALLHACVLDSWSSYSVFDHAVSHVDCCCGYLHLLSAVCVASLVSTADSFHCCLTADVQYNLDGVSRLEGIMGCFNALGTIAFAYGGHNVVLEIQVSSSDKHPCNFASGVKQLSQNHPSRAPTIAAVS